jgi:hypothetical protein
MQEHIQLQINRNVLETGISLATVVYSPVMWGRGNNFRKEYMGPDNNPYVVSGKEIVTVPHDVGTAWLSLDPDLEQVSRS